MAISIEDYYHDFRQEMLSGAESREDFLEAEFSLIATKLLEEAGSINGFDLCQYKSLRGVRVDGYWINNDGISLDLFITDFSNREGLESLTLTNVDALFKRVENFFTSSAEKKLYADLEETSLGYGLARDLSVRAEYFTKINFHLVSERNLSEKIKAIDDKAYKSWTFTYNIWDMSRLHRIYSSSGVKEEIAIDFTAMFGQGVRCLPAHLNTASYESYLVVMPANYLAAMYGKYGDRLLEQNVRCFLQVRGNVNKGIRATILNDPEMFFAYNNGITATAKEVDVEKGTDGFSITGIRDLQIVNGGQTTASLFHTNRKDKASLDNIFVQLKLSIVDEEKGEEVVPKISEYANTQNKVNAADFFANHPFHVRQEGFSRRLWVPAQQGMLRETKWFYERARGQYADAQSKLTKSEQKKFLAEFPASQMFSKTDLAKFENVWDDKPHFVNLGSQKNFAFYAFRIGQEWSRNPDNFNEYYYKRAIARAILFKRLEKLVSAQPWYNGGYRANIVAYTLSVVSEICKTSGKDYDFNKIWELQDVPASSIEALIIIAKAVMESIMAPPQGISNVGEWCKKEACWDQLKQKIPTIVKSLSPSFMNSLSTRDVINQEIKEAVQTQKLDNGIDAQTRVLQISAKKWYDFLVNVKRLNMFSPKELDIIQVASMIPNKIPSEKQCKILLSVIQKAAMEGIKVE